MDKLIVVCSKNAAKNLAVKTVLDEYFEKYEILSLDTNSGVSETPVGDDEGITGCLNRIKDAITQNNKGNIYIAMEGILTKSICGTFLCGWTVVYDKDLDTYSYGCSAKVKIPDEIANSFDKFERLSNIVAKYYNTPEDEIRIYGTNGVITNGVYTRTDEFIDSIKCAISTKFERNNKHNEKFVK